MEEFQNQSGRIESMYKCRYKSAKSKVFKL